MENMPSMYQYMKVNSNCSLPANVWIPLWMSTEICRRGDSYSLFEIFFIQIFPKSHAQVPVAAY